MQTIQLKAMTRELCHELYRHWTNDASIYMDMRLFRPYVYDEVAVNRYFDAKGQDASRRLFAIMLGDTVVGELQLKQIEHDKKECTLSIHMQNDAVKGKGYGTQAERLAVKIAFDELGMAAVNADTVMKNTRSQRVLEKAGFRFVGEDDPGKVPPVQIQFHQCGNQFDLLQYRSVPHRAGCFCKGYAGSAFHRIRRE